MGKATSQLPYLLAALRVLGRTGFAPRRSPFAVSEIVRLGFNVGSRSVGWLRLPRPLPTAVTRATLEFVTPLRMKKYGRYLGGRDAPRIDFRILFDSLTRRVGSLVRLYGGGTFDAAPLCGKARQIVTLPSRMRTVERWRFSTRRKRRLPLHGVVGRLVFEGDLAPFLPLLVLGQWLHVGTGTTMGLGQYYLHVDAQPHLTRPRIPTTMEDSQ